MQLHGITCITCRYMQSKMLMPMEDNDSHALPDDAFTLGLPNQEHFAVGLLHISPIAHYAVDSPPVAVNHSRVLLPCCD